MKRQTTRSYRGVRHLIRRGTVLRGRPEYRAPEHEATARQQAELRARWEAVAREQAEDEIARLQAQLQRYRPQD